jgi:predicted nucleic acid-binding Zn ribbon protein
MKMADADPVCPKCGAKCNRQIAGPSGIAFKGTGFYVTDYKGKK